MDTDFQEVPRDLVAALARMDCTYNHHRAWTGADFGGSIQSVGRTTGIPFTARQLAALAAGANK